MKRKEGKNKVREKKIRKWRRGGKKELEEKEMDKIGSTLGKEAGEEGNAEMEGEEEMDKML